MECKASNGCEYLVKRGQSVKLTLALTASPTTYPYSISVWAGALPGNCKLGPTTPPEIIVTDDKVKVKSTAGKKTAPKRRAAK